MIRLLHTADWHLGHRFQGWSREVEHARALDRLVETAAARRIHALVIAGDVFDSQNPPAEAEALFYRTIVRLRDACPGLAVVVAAGNHDPAGRIEAPNPLYAALGIRAVGTVRRTDGHIDLSRHLVSVEADGERAHVLALPHLGPACLGAIDRASEGSGSPVVRAVRVLYAEAIDAARARIGGEALVVTGHLTVAGGLESEGAERRILIGGEHAVPSDIFPDDLAYVALGHLHKPQPVGRPTVRYSGSLIPLSATERGYRHGVSLVTIAGGLATPEHIELPRPVPFLRVPAEGTIPPEAVTVALAALGLDPDLPLGERPLVHLALRLDGPAPNLKAELDRAAESWPVRLVGHTIERATADPVTAIAEEVAADLADRDPTDLFRAAFVRAHGTEPEARHLDLFARILAEA